MSLHTLTALSPLDGRYETKLSSLRPIFSEYGLMKYRLLVEIRWFIFLCELEEISDLPKLSAPAISFLESLYEQFSEHDAAAIKTIEKNINHDVKSVEYFLKEKFADQPELAPLSEWIHFCCTSEDINNIAYALMIKDARDICLTPLLHSLCDTLKQQAHHYAALPMLARTHGQAATPTTLGKELANVVARLQRQIQQLANTEILAKFNGATGNYNAHAIAYPEQNWPNLSAQFIASLKLTSNAYTTQIEPHDALSEFFSILIRINTILIDYTRDIWSYIAIHYFKQKSLDHEVGSSTMPHKINPIDFENAEGNLGLANALLKHFITKLPISRWQRDLSDSTVLRNIGVAIGYTLLAYQAILKGMSKLEPHIEHIQSDLNQHWEVLAEAIQTIMRRYQLPQPYEALKSFTRGKQINTQTLHDFIRTLSIPEHEKQRLLELTPATYLGYAHQLAQNI